MAPRYQSPRLREALFGLADSRGNNPHGTSETSDHESRRINSYRYETVGQMDAALDGRARRPQQVARQLGDVDAGVPGATPTAPPAGTGFGLFGALLILGAGFLIANALSTKGDGLRTNPGEPDEDDDIDGEPKRRTRKALPETTSQPQTIVVLPQTSTTVASVPAAQPPPEEPKRKRRRRGEAKAEKKAAETAQLNAFVQRSGATVVNLTETGVTVVPKT